jgi:hypothetical protein
VRAFQEIAASLSLLAMTTNRGMPSSLDGLDGSTAVIEVAFGKASQRIMDFPIDLDPLADKA